MFSVPLADGTINESDRHTMIAPIPIRKPRSRGSSGKPKSVKAPSQDGLIPGIVPSGQLTVAGGPYMSRKLRAWYAAELAGSIATGAPWLGQWRDDRRRNRVGVASDIIDRQTLALLANGQGAGMWLARRRYDLADPQHYLRLVEAAKSLKLNALIIESPGNRTKADAGSANWLLRFAQETDGTALIWVTGKLQKIEQTVISAVARHGGRATECWWTGPTVSWADWCISQPVHGLPRYGVRIRKGCDGCPVSTAGLIGPADGCDFSRFFIPGPAVSQWGATA